MIIKARDFSLVVACLLILRVNCDNHDWIPTTSWNPKEWSPRNQPVLWRNISNECRISRNKVEIKCFGKRLVEFPKNLTLLDETTELSIGVTAITRLKLTDFEKLKRLQSMRIESNSKLTGLDPEIFEGMDNMVNLSIIENKNLTELHRDTFKGLNNLIKLELSGNGFEKILSVTQSLNLNYIPKVKIITLNRNLFRRIEEDSFSGLNGAHLFELNLVLCEIDNVSRKAFNGFKVIETLRLGQNHIKEKNVAEVLDQLIQNHVQVSTLSLSNLQLKEGNDLNYVLSKVNNLPIKHLDLSSNRFEDISEKTFPAMPSIEILDLQDVSALKIKSNALSPQNLPNLKILLLGKNKLSLIPTDMDMPNLETMDLSEQDNKNLELRSDNFQKYPKLISLNLSNNTLKKISNKTFSGLSNLRYLGLQNSNINFIDPNTFAMLTNLKVLNLEQNPFLFLRFNMRSPNIFNGLESLEVLNLANCNIRYFRNFKLFESMPNLHYLNLQGNSLVKLDDSLLGPLKSLRGLDLSNNHLSPWHNRIVPQKSMKTIILSNNRLNYISPAMMEDFQSLTQVDLSRNPFACDCSYFTDTINFLQLTNLTTEKYNNVFCSTKNNKISRVGLFLKTNTCTENNVIMLISTIIGLLIISIILVVITYYYKPYIRYWIFLMRIKITRCSPLIRRGTPRVEGHYKYDVFVSYSHDDRDFIIRLVSMLENQPPYLKLCIYERDFEIGSIISDTIAEKVSSSKRILLVLSDSFAKSQWCMWEMQLAEYRRIFYVDKASLLNPLIFIKLSSISESNLTPTLRFLLKTRIYLEWHDNQLFWEKLRNVLSPETSLVCIENV